MYSEPKYKARHDKTRTKKDDIRDKLSKQKQKEESRMSNEKYHRPKSMKK